MLRYVHRLTTAPSTVTEADIDTLRSAGFSDQAIGDIATNCALFAFFTRIVDGLGATLEPDMAAEAERLGIQQHGPDG